MRNVSLDTKDALLNNLIYNKIFGPELGHSRATTREEWFTMDTDTGSERLHWWSLTVKPMHNLFHLLNSRFITVAILQCNRVLGDTRRASQQQLVFRIVQYLLTIAQKFFCREKQLLHSATAEGVRTRRVSDLETLIVMTRHNTEPEPGHWSHTDSSIQHTTMVNWTLPAKYETDITPLNAAQHPAIPNTELRRRLTVC